MSAAPKPKRIRISPEEAKAQYDEGDVTVLDVVDTHVYERFSYQVKGAVRIDPEEISDAYERLPKDLAVLTYCT